MSHYLFKFIFYTSGVIGLLMIAYVFAKSYLNGSVSFKKKSGNLEIEESLPISPRKSLHIVRAFDEKFLVATDSNTTTLLAKLGKDEEIEQNEQTEEFRTVLANENSRSARRKSSSVIHSMLEKLNN